MLNFFRTGCAIAALLGTVMLLPSAHAAVPGDAPVSYADMCVQSADMPKPFGESDLKGHAKLKAYCECFGPKFMARAQAAAQNMGNGKAPPPADQTEKEELAMRNSCRKPLGLPLAR